MLASNPARTLNQIIPDFGLPIPSKRASLEQNWIRHFLA
jgi:hypothetical protein